jgi:exodeoxyribonuclease-3
VSLRVLSYNIRYGGVGRETQIASVIRACDPDLVIFQEATRRDVVERIAAASGMPTSGAIRGHSLAFLSRVEIAHHAWHTIRFAKRRYLEIVLKHSGTRIFGVHLAAVHSNLTEIRRSYEVRSLLRGIAHHQHGFHLVTGDFNTLAPGEEFDINRLPPRLRAMVWLTGRKLRWTTIKLMLDGGYIDGYRFMQKDDQGYTFPTHDPHVRLDYAFVPSVSIERLTRCEVVRDAPSVREASDHFPLLCELADR